jgi:hypothetical protein
MAHFLQVLENDLRLLSSEARRNDGFGGFFSGASFPDVKEAAENAILKVRSLPVDSEASQTIAGLEVRKYSENMHAFVTRVVPRVWPLRSLSCLSPDGTVCPATAAAAVSAATGTTATKPPDPTRGPTLASRLSTRKRISLS